MEMRSPLKANADPRRYFESVGENAAPRTRKPVCLYLETTNRCNLLCTTCPRTYEELEPPADMSWELFRSIVDQVPDIERAVLHGVGEPMLVRNLPKMVRYLKERGTYVLFNTNGTVLNEKNGRALIEAGLDELRVSLDAANAKSYLAVRGKDYFSSHPAERAGVPRAAGARWHRSAAGLGLAHRPEGNDRRAARLRAGRRRDRRQGGLSPAPGVLRERVRSATPGRTRRLYERLTRRGGGLHRGSDQARALVGMTFSASGAASEPGMSLKRHDDGSPWSMCRRPWTVMYFTANGRALPCCIAPFSQRGYENYTLGDATQQTLREIWNGPAYQSFREALLSDKPPAACASCGLRWSL